MSTSDVPHDPLFLSSRRRFLAGAAAGTGGLLVAGSLPQQALAATSIDHAFAGLAAFVVPGNDQFSRQQGVMAPGPGGVDAQGGRVVIETLDAALPIVVGRTEAPAPGALGIAILLDNIALQKRPLSIVGPFASPFANLKFLDKRAVLEQIDNLPLLRKSTLEFGANALITLAGMGSFSERASFDRRAGVLTSRPRSWDRTRYGGVSDGWPEFIGYYQGRTEVSA